MVNYSLNDLFGSLSDTTRRDMVQRLLMGELTISQLAETYNMSLPAVSKHLRVLEASKLIVKEKRGRQYFVRLTPTALKEAREHLQHYEAVLHNRLDSFGAYLQQKSTAIQRKVLPTPPTNKQRSIVITNILDTDLATTWRAYTDPVSIKRWWNLPGTQLLKAENDVRVGGNWCFTLRGADNHEYIVSGKYRVVEYPHRLEYTDGAGDPDSPRPEAHVTISFEQLPGNKTMLTKTSIATPAVHQLNAAWLQAIGGN
jgi:uncharacterized protein YndB with AHSA1/START domain/DNA-binding transcriptional ArsR family regulator